MAGPDNALILDLDTYAFAGRTAAWTTNRPPARPDLLWMTAWRPARMPPGSRRHGTRASHGGAEIPRPPAPAL